MAEFHRIKETRGRVYIVDIDNKPLSPEAAKRLAEGILDTVNAKSYVYVGYRKSDGIYKIGMTTNLKRRETELDVEFLHTIECDMHGDYSAFSVETVLHHFFEKYSTQVANEYFDLGVHGFALINEFCKDGRTTLDFIGKLDKEVSDVWTTISQDTPGTLARLVAECCFGVDQFRYVALMYVVMQIEHDARKHDKAQVIGYTRALKAVMRAYATLSNE